MASTEGQDDTKAEMERIWKEINALKAEVTKLRSNDQNDPPKPLQIQTDNSSKNSKKDENCQRMELESPPKESLITLVINHLDKGQPMTTNQNGSSKVVPTQKDHHDMDISHKSQPATMATSPNEALIPASVLAEVFTYLDFEDMKSFRLVCSKWAETSSAGFLSKARMRACSLDVFERPMSRFEGAFPANGESKRFTALVIEDMAIFYGMMKRPWLLSYGPSLTHVQLGFVLPKGKDGKDGFPNDLQPNRFLQEENLEDLLLTVCPNLKKLVLPFPLLSFSNRARPLLPRQVHLKVLQMGADACPKTFDKNRMTCFATALATVFDCVASIQILRLESQSLREALPLNRFFKIVRKVTMANIVLEGLGELDLSNWPTSDWLLERLGTFDFRNLKTLTLGRLVRGDLDTPAKRCRLAKHLLDLLAKISHTLEELTLMDRTESTPLEIALPDLPKLRTLRIQDAGAWVFESIYFVLRTPGLEQLELRMKRVPLGDLLRSTIQLVQRPHGELRNFHIRCKAQDPIGFGILVKCFPNVERVVCALDGTAGNIRGCLGGLTSLMQLKVLNLSIRVYFKSSKEEDDEEDLRDLDSIFTSVLPKLPALERLSLDVNEPFSGEWFTSGFLKCPKLKTLDLYQVKLSRGEDWDSLLKAGQGLQITVHGRIIR